MRKAVKGIGFILAGILVLALLAVTYVYILTGGWLEESYDIQVTPVAIPDSPPAELIGFQQMLAEFCEECLGPGVSGQVMEDDPVVARLVAPNLTAGWGGVGGTYRDEDWVRALRQGVGIDGQSLLVMPSDMFYHLSDADLAPGLVFQSPPPSERPGDRAPRADPHRDHPAAPDNGPPPARPFYIGGGPCLPGHNACRADRSADISPPGTSSPSP